MDMINLVYIHTHDTGRYIEPYGYAVHTPHLQSLASQSTVFRNAHSTSPTCSPSRAGLLTGTYPHESGMLGLAHRGFRLNKYQQHIVSHLKNVGYTTALSGVQHVAPRKELIGYDYVLDASQEYFDRGIQDSTAYDMENSELAAEFIESVDTAGGVPFFLSFGMLNTHRPFPKPESRAADFIRPPCSLPDTAAVREDAAGFYTALETVDRCVGRVLAALERSGHDKDTLVLFTTDHGPAFPGMKATLHDSGTGVALMMRLPSARGTAAAGPKICDALVSQLDIFPTICELTGTPHPHQMRGLSLLPLLYGTQRELHSHLYTETTFHAACEPARAVRSRRYKLIRHYSAHECRLPANVDDSAVKDLFHKSGYFSKKVSREELFDLVLDPLERCNRLNDPRYRSVYRELELALDEWMNTTGDPLLGGAVNVPAGALLNSASSYSPDSGEFV